MGYFVQITGDAGSPLFQAAKNYPEVSFASSALFHALVTAGLEHGFVPSVLRAQDVTIALAVHGCPGSRLSIALVSSEFPAGETRDIEAQLHWRLNAIYRGALVAAGGDALRRQPRDALTRVLTQRLAPVVARLMSEEPVPGIVGRVPRLGLATVGAAAEWLPASGATDAAFERLVASLPAGGGVVLAGLSLSATDSTLAVLSWQGRGLACTPAWRRLDSVDRALLLLLADEVGPASFEQPTRSWALEAVDGLWLPSAAAAVQPSVGGSPSPAASPSLSASPSVASSPGGAGAAFVTTEAEALLPLGLPARQATAVTGQASRRIARRHRMISARIYPNLEVFDLGSSERGGVLPPDAGESELRRLSLAEDDGLASPAEVAAAWRDEASLVFSILVPEGENDAGAEARARISAEDVLQSAELCGRWLQDLWRSLRAPAARRPLLVSAHGEVAAAMLLDEATQDVVVAPASWHASEQLPWCCPVRRAKGQAMRRLLYWLHTLPPLDESRPQAYACCEDYAVGALRREDGLQCWALMHLSLGESAESSAAVGEAGTTASGPQPPVLQVAAELMARVPASGDFRRSFATVY